MISITLFALIASWSVSSSKPIGPGDPLIDGSSFKPYKNIWEFIAIGPDGKERPQGLWTDFMMPFEKDGKRLMRRIQGMTYVNGKSSTTVNVFDPVTLKPISSLQQQIDGTIVRREFSDNLVITKTTKPGVQEAVTTTAVPGPFLDFFGGMYGTIFAAMPLKVGLQGTLSSYAEFDEESRNADFKVLRTESVAGGWMGMVQTFVVEATDAETTMTFWISKEEPYVIRLDMQRYDAKRVATGPRMSFQMIGGKTR